MCIHCLPPTLGGIAFDVMAWHSAAVGIGAKHSPIAAPFSGMPLGGNACHSNAMARDSQSMPLTLDSIAFDGMTWHSVAAGIGSRHSPIAQCYGWPIHAAHILQIPCRFAPYSCHLRPLAHPSASCAPSTYPNIHYHCLAVPLAHPFTSCTSYANNPSTYHKIYYYCLLVPSAHPYPLVPTDLWPTCLYCSIVYH